MTALDIRTRLEFGWPKPTVPRANTDLGMVAHYDGSNQGLADKPHSACLAYWTHTRAFHVAPVARGGRGWSDIGYAYGVCPHGSIFEGRGYGYQQAAQVQQGNGLPHGNDRWVSCTFMSGPSEHPTDAQLAAWHHLRAWLMDSKKMKATVKGHRNFSMTDCPGDLLYGLVTDGSLAKTPTDLGEDEMALPILHQGSKGYDVKTLRALLFARGLVPVAVVADSALRGWLDTEEFDNALLAIVMGFQRLKGLVPDGVVGPKTWAKLQRQ